MQGESGPRLRESTNSKRGGGGSGSRRGVSGRSAQHVTPVLSTRWERGEYRGWRWGVRGRRGVNTV